MTERLSFHDEILRNKRNSYFLIGIVLIVLLALVYVIAALMDNAYFFFILIFGTILSLTYVVGGYYNSHKLAIASVGAKLSTRLQYPHYHNLVEGLTLASGLPKPELYVMQDEQINAFASGRDPSHAVICVTTGCLEKLSKQELEGVLAHEMSHIANYDIKFMTLTAVLVGMVSIIAQIFLRSLFWGSLGSNDRDNRAGVILMVIGILLAIIAPIVTVMVQMAISRKREYVADSSAVKFIRSPTGLIGALEKIKSNSELRNKGVSGAISPLFIAKPTRTKELFQTHPPLQDRINKLRKM